MEKSLTLKIIFRAIVAAGVVGSAHAASGPIFSDDFNYASVSAFQTVWTPVYTLTQPAPSITVGAAGLGGGDSAVSITRMHSSNHLRWNQTWSYTPTDAFPLILTVRMFDPGPTTPLLRNTVGVRTAFSPMFEIGFNNANLNQYAVRLVGFHEDPGWFYFGEALPTSIRAAGWHTFQARLGATFVNVELDLLSDSTIDHTMSFTGVMPGPFSELRIGGPAGAAAQAGNPVSYTFLDLQVIPEPGAYAAIFGALALIGAVLRRKWLCESA